MKKNIQNLILILLVIIVALLPANAQQKLIHYWHFNNLVSPVVVPVNPALLPAMKAGYSSLDTNKAFIYYKTIPGTSLTYQTYYDSTAGDTLNSRKAQLAGKSVRLRNPSDSMQLVFNIPSTAYQNITIKYEVQRSGATTGSPAHFFDYSTDSGTTWRTFGLTATMDSTGYGAWTFCTTSISDIESYNNKKLLLRIKFAGPTNVGTSGFNKIDNFTIEGDTFLLMNPPLYNIAQINRTNSVTGVPDSLNAKATVRGVVYGFNQKTTAGGYQFSIKDQTGAISVYHATKTFGYAVSEGDSLQVSGTIFVFRGLTQLFPDTLIHIASGRTLKSIISITQLDENYESNLIKMSNLVFYSRPSGGVWPTSSSTILCHTLGSNDTVPVSVLSTSGIAGALLPSTTTFSVSGLETQVSTSLIAPFAFNGYQILPRYAADVTNGISLPDTINGLSVSAKTLTSIQFTWNKPITYVDSTMSMLFFLKQGSPINAGLPNYDDSYYSANPDFTSSGTKFQNDSLAKCMMNSDGANVTITGLMQNVNYYATVFVFRKTDSVYSFPVSIVATPVSSNPMPVSSIQITGLTSSITKISWVKPFNYFNSQHTTLVFVKDSNNINIGTPTNSISFYYADSVFKQGSNYENDTKAYCVYKGDSNTVTVSGLSLGTTYKVLIFVVRDSDNVYSPPSIGTGVTLPQKKLIHYWNFNHKSTGLIAPVVANTFAYWGINADYSSLDTSKATIFYRTFNGTSDDYQTYWDTTSGAYTNMRKLPTDSFAGSALRVRNPSDSMQLLFYIPTTHYKNITVTYASQKSSFASAQYQQNFDYSINNGNSWQTTGLSVLLDSNITENFSIVTISFMTNDTFAYNNPNFVFRIRFEGNTNSNAGNNRFDNFTVEGDTTTVTPFIGVNEIKKSNSSFTLIPNPASNNLTIKTDRYAMKNIFIMNITGQIVAQTNTVEMESKIDISLLPAGLYFIHVIENDLHTIRKLMKE